jgi:hypothetical protein
MTPPTPPLPRPGETIEAPFRLKNMPMLMFGASVAVTFIANVCCACVVGVPALLPMGMLIANLLLYSRCRRYEEEQSDALGYYGPDRLTVERKNWLIGGVIASVVGVVIGIAELVVYIAMQAA